MSSAFVRGVMRCSISSGRSAKPSSARVGTCMYRAAGEQHARQVGDVAGIGAQHFVAGIEDRLERDVQRLADA